MSITHAGNVGQAANAAGGTSLDVTLTSDVKCGEALVVYIVWGQNNGSTEITNFWASGMQGRMLVSDPMDNTYVCTAYGEYQGSGSSGNRGALGIFTMVATSNLKAGQKLTCRYFTSQPHRMVSVHKFTGLTKKNLVVVGTAGVAGSATTAPAALTISGLKSQEYLFLHLVNVVSGMADTYTQDSDYTSGTAVSDNAWIMRPGFRVFTGTGDTVGVTNSVSRNIKEVFCAVMETDMPHVRWTADTINNNTGAPSFDLSTPSAGLYLQKGDVVVVLGGLGGVANYWPGEGWHNAIGRFAPNGDTFQIFWKRVYDPTSFSISFPDFGSCNCFTPIVLSGCDFDKDPFDILYAATDTNTATANVDLPSITPTESDTLLLYIVQHGRSTAGQHLSSLSPGTNTWGADEIYDNGSALAPGLGWGVARMWQDGSSTPGAGTWTLDATGEEKCVVVLGLRSKNRLQSEPSIDLVDYGHSTGAVTLAWPAGTFRQNDLIVLAYETAADPATPSGFTEVPNSPQNESTNTYCSVFYKVADGTETGITIADSGDHTQVTAYRVRGADHRDPINATAGGSDGTANTSVSLTGPTTTKDNCLVVHFVADSKDYQHAHLENVTNSALTSMRKDGSNKLAMGGVAGTTDGNGGAIGAVWGVKASAGACGTSSGTFSFADSGTTTKAWVTVAFNPKQKAGAFRPGAVAA